MVYSVSPFCSGSNGTIETMVKCQIIAEENLRVIVLMTRCMYTVVSLADLLAQFSMELQPGQDRTEQDGCSGPGRCRAQDHASGSVTSSYQPLEDDVTDCRAPSFG